ncbi:LacI family DNA-binding transcriptional regulator [Coraliomargarita sp. SDUM461003]|uniref:LacI family DNA-binding transcriptional regulator n=1 Tax=Thalassobacterium maritimum TaxID=3041265 RepID=A0ABU1AVW0_9BACT|nr:LacI family DNA-binding transcriptional regulator [Coraliomargarita sp. SDUM461003]MDQ8208288.1 LacI family DNA-binding transcriptional regulator [Coraliomargarita sp. SDUM461003]
MPNTPERRPNMQQIGDAAGVSKSAVSLALRNDPRIPEATRLRIQQIAEEMGYRRNPVVDSLMTQLRAGRQPTFQANLGLINCSPVSDLGQNHTFRRLREGVLRRAEALGYGIEEFWLQQPDMRPQRLKQIVETRGIRGLILIAALSPDTIDRGYVDFWYDFACAVIGVTHLNNRLNCASNDQYLTARRATEKVFELGYQRPMLVVPPNDDALLEDKFSAGFYSAVRRLSPQNQLAVVPLDMDDPSVALQAIRLEKPDVVITNQSEFYDILHDAGFSIPRELGLVHLDWHCALANIAGMRQNNRVVGSAGVDLVVGQLQKNEFGSQEFPKVVQIESIWVDGPSVKMQ